MIRIPLNFKFLQIQCRRRRLLIFLAIINSVSHRQYIYHTHTYAPSLKCLLSAFQVAHFSNSSHRPCSWDQLGHHPPPPPTPVQHCMCDGGNGFIEPAAALKILFVGGAINPKIVCASWWFHEEPCLARILMIGSWLDGCRKKTAIF